MLRRLAPAWCGRLTQWALTENRRRSRSPTRSPGNPKGFRSKGPTAEAVKRALAHLGFMEWGDGDWDQHWNAEVNDAADAVEAETRISTPDGSWGDNAHDVMRTAWYEKSRATSCPPSTGTPSSCYRTRPPPPTTDGKSRDPRRHRGLLRTRDGLDQMDVLPEPGRRRVRRPEGLRHLRLFRSLIQAFHHARQKTGLEVPDPAKQNWSGLRQHILPTRTTGRPSRPASTRSAIWPTTTATSASVYQGRDRELRTGGASVRSRPRGASSTTAPTSARRSATVMT